MGNSSSKSTTIRNALSAVQKALNESIVSVNNSCKAEATASNTLVNLAEGDARVETAVLRCLELGNTPEGCAKLRTGATMKDVDMRATSSISAGCEIKQDMLADIQAQMKSNLEAQMKQMNDDFGKALNSMVKAFNVAGSDDETTSITNEQAFSSEVVNKMTIQVVQEAVAKAAAMNDFTNSAKGLASSTVEGIVMDAQAAVLMNALAKSEALQKAAASMENEAKTNTDIQNKGLTDLTDSVFGGISGVISSATTAWGMAIGGAILIAFCACMVLMFGMGGGSSRGSGPTM